MSGADGARASYLEAFGEGPGYLDFARVGPLSRPVIQARSQAAQSLLDPTAAVIDNLMAAHHRSLEMAASIAGLPVADLIYTPNTSTGLFQVAFAMLPSRRRTEVLLSADEFPSNTYPWVRAAGAGRLTPAFIASGSGPVSAALIAANLTERTAAVSVSAVDFRTGHRADLAAIRAVIGDRWLVVDGIQGFGAVPMDWASADAVVVGGQKWLRSGWGTGFVAVSERLCSNSSPLLSGWTAVEQPGLYDGVIHAVLPGPGALSITNLSPIDQSALVAGLALVESVGLEWISARISDTAGHLAQRLRSTGAAVIGDPSGACGSGIVPFAVPAMDQTVVHQRLAAAGISSTLHGDRIRLSVHATTTDESIDMVLAALADRPWA